MAWQATHRFARGSARKVRLMAALIRGREVQDALNILKFTPNLGAAQVRKVLTSAVANANEAEADVESLVVTTAFVNEGPVMKRFREKDRGRAHSILKRTSHITVVLDEQK
jgi:large subunit ribosomal protein L22